MLAAALMETARLCHPRLGHKLDQETWMKVFVDRHFQEACNGLVAKETKKGLFAKPSAQAPGPEDYRELGQKHADSLSRWEQWGSVRAFFHVLDAEVALEGLADGPFLSHLVGDILEDDMADQVYRGYLHL